MNARSDLLTLLAGVVAVLAVASAIAYVLNRRAASDTSETAVANLVARVKAWWVMVALLGAAFAFGRTGVVVLFAFVSLAALREFITLAPTRRGDHAALAVAFFVVLPVQYYLVWMGWYGLYSIFIPVYAFVVLGAAAALRRDTTNFAARVAETQWGLMLAVFSLSHVPALLGLQIPGYDGRQLLLVAFLVLVVESSDVLQYVWGKLCGRRKIAPELSPSKTVEGFAGGVASATGLAALLWWITPFSAAQAAAIGLAINLIGFLGGLVLSALKRDRGVKDWGWLIAGHGGVLDRLDSVSFAAPIFFHLVRYFYAA